MIVLSCAVRLPDVQLEVVLACRATPRERTVHERMHHEWAGVEEREYGNSEKHRNHVASKKLVPWSSAGFGIPYGEGRGCSKLDKKRLAARVWVSQIKTCPGHIFITRSILMSFNLGGAGIENTHIQIPDFLLFPCIGFCKVREGKVKPHISV